MPLFLWKGKQIQRGQVVCLNSHSYLVAEFRLLAPPAVFTPLPFFAACLCRVRETSGSWV